MSQINEDQITVDKRHKRQMDVIPPIFYARPVTVIGCGAIGRQVALQLASAGVTDIALIDADVVTETNLSNQGFQEKDLGQYKTDVCQDDMLAINSKALVYSRKEMLIEASYPSMLFHGVKFETVFLCVDTITARKNIFELIEDKVDILIDGRMTAESMRIISVYKNKPLTKREIYTKTLFEQSEAQGGRCTAKSTIYCANIAAGFMVSQYTKILRGFQPEGDFCVNLLGNVIEIL